MLCPVQVATVDGMDLNHTMLSKWISTRGSKWVEGMTVNDFLSLRSREARRDLLHLASKQLDGTFSLDLDEAAVLADALESGLYRGV